MTPNAFQWLWPVFFYLVGSIPAGFLMGLSQGIDIRTQGSGNIGATNVWRVMGKSWGIAAFTCDFLKGFLPLFLLRRLGFSDGNSWSISLLLVACGLGAILGHNYTPWLGFKGGKGIATTAGVLGALMPWVLALSLSVWILSVLTIRVVSIASILAAVVLPPLAFWFYPGQWIYFGLTALAAVLGIWRHRSNIQRLIAGTEPRISFSSKKEKAP